MDHGGQSSFFLQLVKTPFFIIVVLLSLIEDTPFNRGSFSELSKISLLRSILVSFAINFCSARFIIAFSK
jgi:hypothetical protein